MRQCFNCDRALPEGAQFCPNCGNGAPVAAPALCVRCERPLPKAAHFCPACGLPVPRPRSSGGALPITVITQEDIQLGFGRAFEAYFAEEYPALAIERVRRHLRHSPFQKILTNKFKQLQRDTLFMQDQGQSAASQWAYLAYAFYELLDFFVVRFGGELTGDPLPEAILQHQGKTRQTVDRIRLIFDYLQLEDTDEKVYTDFVREMPPAKLRNATHSFLFPPKNERILFISDQSTFGSLREGYAMTEAAIYWKAHFERPAHVRYDNLRAVRRQEKWITINGLFFNVNPRLNLRMLKLLRKLQFIYNPAIA